MNEAGEYSIIASGAAVPNGTNYNTTLTYQEGALTVMLWRYAGSPAAPQETLDFIDTDQVSNYAKEALLWANKNGIVNGRPVNVLDPADNATCAKVAQMMNDYIERIMG